MIHGPFWLRKGSGGKTSASWEKVCFCYVLSYGKNDKSEVWTNRALSRFGGNFKVQGCLNTFLWPPLHEMTADERKADNDIALMWRGKAHGHSVQRTRRQLCILVSLWVRVWGALHQPLFAESPAVLPVINCCCKSHKSSLCGWSTSLLCYAACWFFCLL